jgi:hypothetical protein
LEQHNIFANMLKLVNHKSRKSLDCTTPGEVFFFILR